VIRRQRLRRRPGHHRPRLLPLPCRPRASPARCESAPDRRRDGSPNNPLLPVRSPYRAP
jgi:hypothetical protein